MERAAVLRVKRKRGGPEPAEALVLACKRFRTEQGLAEPRENQVEKNLFKLVVTVASQNEPFQKYVQEAITRDKTSQILRPSLGSAQRIIQDLRSSKQATRQENRYRLIASHRPNCVQKETTDLEINGVESDENNKLDSEAKKDFSQKENNASDVSSDPCREFQFFDIVQDEEVKRDHTTSSQKIDDPDVILCNAVEMIRERLTISESDKGEKHHEKEDDYVYDIYYMETSSPGWIQNILSVQPYSQEYELVDDDHVSEEIYDDEDDENNENNWRNDYPDEDEFLPEEGEDDSDKETRGEESEEGSFRENDGYFTRRTLDKYHCDVLREFEYDGSQDLDSD
uniref:Probable RNA polymerase II nuclear localization protein SLC7A6OS n=1 Tax=Sphenodon punctatus TaxID=8508 RepID=A0A8D0GE88_SPHPU